MPKAGTLPSRVIAVLLLVLVLLVTYQAMVEPIVHLYRDNATAITRKEDSLQRYRRLANERETLAERLSRLQQDQSAIAGYIVGSSDALAATAIQDQATAAVDEAGGDVKSVELLAPSSEDDYPAIRRVGLRLRLAVSIEGLARVIHALEDAEPYLFIGSLQASTSRGNRQEPERQLDVKLDIFGYAQESSHISSAIESLNHGT